ncbi:PELI1 [Bugula neritina]|uniref:PELI1 n=1 Tax=Bugula neritina TaxID=10212 RepID=A0A7J7JPX8_BUGNE|nr:PELI1 [Bugula neritina]
MATLEPLATQLVNYTSHKRDHSGGDKSKHSVSYTLSRTQAVVVEYEKDEHTDMFQIGRSSETPIDFVVTDTLPGSQRVPGQTQVAQSTISRFSCRICVERSPPYTARIYAAGFDQHNHIFLGEKASKWYNQRDEIDGLTTNGVLLTHPRGQFAGKDCRPGKWREVSVRGGIYSLRETRSVPSKSQKVDSESNILMDGTLIDLCGATLIWRSQKGLEQAPQIHQLEEYIEQINAARPQCPVGLTTLMLPKRSDKIDKSRQPYVYLACGHVHGSHSWKGDQNSTTRTCPMCLKEGPFVQVQVGRETSIYTDTHPLTHIFTPCAHLTSEKTARYWSSVVIPYGCQGFRAMCPYCATYLSPMDSATKANGYIKLIFQDNTEF